MATFEKRKNSLGETTAIRVKIRRVGMPHLSQTFPVTNGTQTALKQAEKAAKAWVEEVTKGFGIQHGNIKSFKAQFNQLAMHQSPLSNPAPYSSATFPFDRLISKNQGDDFILHADTPDARMLTALLLDCGLSMEEITRLRWQHVLFNQKLVEVMGTSGLLQRQVPLTALAIEMMLAHNQRKYGLMFNGDEPALYEQVPKQLISTLQKKADTALAIALKRETAYRMADIGIDESAVCNYLGINHLKTLKNKARLDTNNPIQAY